MFSGTMANLAKAMANLLLLKTKKIKIEKEIHQSPPSLQLSKMFHQGITRNVYAILLRKFDKNGTRNYSNTTEKMEAISITTVTIMYTIVYFE